MINLIRQVDHVWEKRLKNKGVPRMSHNPLKVEADKLASQYQRGKICWITFKARLDYAIEKYTSKVKNG